MNRICPINPFSKREYWKRISFFMMVALLLSGCQKPREAQGRVAELPDIFPDYIEVAVPYNIAPLNFEVRNADEVKVEFANAGKVLMTVTGDNGAIEIPEKKWHAMLDAQKGGELEVIVSVWNELNPDGVRYKSFYIRIAPDAIDEWIAYRLMEPGYEGWNKMGIYQRNLTSFVEKAVITNQINEKGCVNCHSFHQYSPDRLMFHARGKQGGTVFWKDGEAKKFDFRQMGQKKNGVYPMWHPNGRHLIYSSNDTHQSFYSEGKQLIEVYDLESDLFVFDSQEEKVITDPRFLTKEHWETFPAWSADGKELYFCSAEAQEMPLQYKQLKYHLLKVAFDAGTGTFGERIDTVFHATKNGKSISFPRMSPDGKYLLYTVADCGTFPIHHPEADLEMIALPNGEKVDISLINSTNTESYHSWSSNSRWIMLASRRIDGVFTRLYFAWMDAKGQVHKPFLLPQQHPRHNEWRLKSYNIPEFVSEEVTLPTSEIESLFEP